MKWKKLGLIFELSKHDIPWLQSHAMMPLALELNDKIRVYFTGRHIDGKSRISFFDLNKYNIEEVIYIHDKPLLEVGPIGTFDDCGTVGTFVLKHDEKVYLYYNGYNVRNTVPWSNSIGLAISNDGGMTFQKAFDGPILDRFKLDPYFCISPSIIKYDNFWHMWYTSGTGWINIEGRKEPVYDIKYASSKNGIDWQREGEVCIAQENIEECVARASVLKQEDNLKMWFIYRGSRDFRDGSDSYKIGYAESSIHNPTKWLRDDEKSGISLGPEHFDDKMQAYPCVLAVGQKKYFFYNGNGFGKDGVCIAQSIK